MKKLVAWLAALCMLLTACGALAEDVVGQLRQIVQDGLDSLGYAYEYNEELECFYLLFEMDNDLETVDVTIFLFDDMLSVSVFCPCYVDEAAFDDTAVFLTLANDCEYYTQFRVDREVGVVSCRACNVIEGVLPSGAELATLLHESLFAVSDYGQGLVDVLNGADPYEAFEACQQALENGGSF